MCDRIGGQAFLLFDLLPYRDEFACGLYIEEKDFLTPFAKYSLSEYSLLQNVKTTVRYIGDDL